MGRYVPDVKINSIDEAFLALTGCEHLCPDLKRFAYLLKANIRQGIGIPVSIGIAPTKSLAKVANWYAKRTKEIQGVVMLDTPALIQDALSDFSIKDLWGVGGRYAILLKHNNIRTAAQYITCPDDWLRQNLTINGLRLKYELLGTPCRLLNTEPPVRKSFCSAVGFGKLIPDKDTIQQAMLTYLARVTERLRKQHTAAQVMTIFLHTERHRKSLNGEPARYYYRS